MTYNSNELTLLETLSELKLTNEELKNFCTNFDVE